jgi:hypothetical protein
MSSPYRGSSEAIVEQIASLDARIGDVERSFTESFWGEVAPGLGLDPPARREAVGAGSGPDELLAALSQRESRLEALERIVAGFAAGEEAWRTPPEGAPPAQTAPYDFVTTVNRALSGVDVNRRAFAALVEQLFPGTTLERPTTHALAATVRFEGELFSLTYQPFISSGDKSWAPELVAAVTMPPGAPRLQLEPQTTGREILAAFGLIADVEVGDPDFDGMFLVKGDYDEAKAALGPDVRKALLVLAHVDIPSLFVGPGLAWVRWRYGLSESAVTTALAALRSLRRSGVVRPLRTTSASPIRVE